MKLVQTIIVAVMPLCAAAIPTPTDGLEISLIQSTGESQQIQTSISSHKLTPFPIVTRDRQTTPLFQNIQSQIEFDEALERDGLTVASFISATKFQRCFKGELYMKDNYKTHPSIQVLRINADRSQAIAAQNRITEFPTYIFYKDGEIVERVVGANEDEIRAAFDKHDPANTKIRS